MYKLMSIIWYRSILSCQFLTFCESTRSNMISLGQRNPPPSICHVRPLLKMTKQPHWIPEFDANIKNLYAYVQIICLLTSSYRKGACHLTKGWIWLVIQKELEIPLWEARVRWENAKCLLHEPPGPLCLVFSTFSAKKNSFFELWGLKNSKTPIPSLKPVKTSIKNLNYVISTLQSMKTSTQKSISKETHFYKLKITSKISRSHFWNISKFLRGLPPKDVSKPEHWDPARLAETPLKSTVSRRDPPRLAENLPGKTPRSAEIRQDSPRPPEKRRDPPRSAETRRDWRKMPRSAEIRRDSPRLFQNSVFAISI